MIDFKDHRFEKWIIFLLCVCWYLADLLSDRSRFFMNDCRISNLNPRHRPLCRALDIVPA